jgi:hypothetical protein
MSDWLYRIHTWPIIAAIIVALTVLVVETSDGAVVDQDRLSQRGGWGDLDCESGYLCLYDYNHGDSPAIAIRGFSGWINLRRWDWHNRAAAQRNHRNNIALLAGRPDGQGVRYCAEPNSEDENLNDNAIGRDNAESFKLFYNTGGARCSAFGY